MSNVSSSPPTLDSAPPDKFSPKQLRWAEEYPKHFNAARAARDTGYSVESAADIGYQNKQNAALMELVDERHRALTMSGDEATRHLSDIAATRLNDFMVIRQVQGYELEEQCVSVLIEKQQEEIAFIQQFMKEESLSEADENGITPLGVRLRAAREKLLDYRLDIQRHGNDVVRLVEGRPVTHEVAELDLVALAKAKDTGRIKKFKHTKEGLEVETYAADGAARDILKLNGRYEKHNHQKCADMVITLGGKPFPGQPTSEA